MNKETALTHQLDILTKLIILLGKTYSGVSKPIDDELQKLTGHLSGKPDFTLAEVSINKLTSLIHNSDESVKVFANKASKRLKANLAQLMKGYQQDQVISRRCAQLIFELEQPFVNLSTSQKTQQQVNDFMLGLSQRNQLSNNQTTATNAPAKADSGAIAKANNHIVEELHQLINTYSQRHPEDIKLQEIKQCLSRGMSDDEILQSCVAMIRAIVRDSVSETKMTGKVMQSLTSSLTGINSEMGKSIGKISASFASRKSNDSDLKSALSEVGETIHQSDSLETLQSKAKQQIEHILSSISQREADEQQEKTALIELLDDMQNQLTVLQSRAERYQKKLAEQLVSNQTDELTGLPNRQCYNERLAATIKYVSEKQLSFSLVMVDIDFFKRINDQFGHAAGDKTLREVGRQLSKNLTKQDFLSRWGGEEFAIISIVNDLPSFEQKLNELRESISRIPFKFKDEKISITASFGAAVYHNNENETSLFERADKQLYAAKEAGRNCVKIDTNSP